MEEKIRKVVGGTSPIQRPPRPEFGDYSIFVGPEKAEAVKVSLARELGASAAKVEVASKGFVNITLSREAITFALAETDAKGTDWGKGSAEEGKRVMVEHTQPNPFKEMHIGHLMSNTIGESVVRLLSNQGAVLARANYQGDVGLHVAKALWGLRQAGTTEPATAQELGQAYEAGSRENQEDPTAKAEIDELNKAVYEGRDAALMELWRKGRDVSLTAFEELYRILGTTFDFFFFESETAAPGTRIVRNGVAKGIFEESEGAIIYRGEKKGLHTLVFLTSKGTPTYEAKELGLAFLKEERWPSARSVVTTSTEQIGHFKVVKAALEEIAPLLGEKTTHVAHGFLRLTSGKMSSREGNVITAREFIREVIAKASEKNPDPLIAEQVAVGAIKFMVLRQAPGSDILFDAGKSLSLEGDSGPYLQYALVRARSVLAQTPTGRNDAPESPYLVERIIMHYPEVAVRAAREYAPNLLVTYLLELASEWNSFYAKERIIGGEHEEHKLLIARAFANTMTNGLTLLGIPIPDKM